MGFEPCGGNEWPLFVGSPFFRDNRCRTVDRLNYEKFVWSDLSEFFAFAAVVCTVRDLIVRAVEDLILSNELCANDLIYDAYYM
jgi:hypothetical protein